MVTTAQTRRAYQGPAVLSFGFRPFFLLAGLWGLTAMAVWIATLVFGLTLPTAFAMLDWHVHELIFGYVPAVVAGFLFTAVPNWTGRLPVTGLPLLVTVLIWFTGRLAMMFSAMIGARLAAAIDLSFLLALAAVMGREILAGRTWRNFKVLALVALLFLGNGAYHYEAIAAGSAATGASARLGVAATLLLIMVIGGRIIPSFTHNWLARLGPGRLPKAFNRFDMVVVAASALALAFWVAHPDGPIVALAMAAAAVLNVWRLGRWQGRRTAAEPLVLVLHVAFAFVPLGFALQAVALLAPAVLAAGTALHAWTAGAIGLMTLAVMTRASLGHTGQPLHAGPAITLIYTLVGLAALARIGAGFGFAGDLLTQVAAASWIAGFGLFVAVFAPLLLRQRR
jgi:uncharacterized protein involved in response to NO